MNEFSDIGNIFFFLRIGKKRKQNEKSFKFFFPAHVQKDLINQNIKMQERK